MGFDFDCVIDRRRTNCAKWDLAREDEIPLWVADMDFAAPPEVIAALADRVRHGVFGYPLPTDDYYQAFIRWELEALDFQIHRDWVVHCSAVMPAVRAAVLAFSEPGDPVVVQPPVYLPFFKSVSDNQRTVIENPLVLEGAQYRIDFDHLRRIAAEDRPKVLLLCSPHNPVGRVWTTEELLELVGICLEYGITIVADEIHCGVTYEGHSFVSVAAVSDDAAQICVACHSPSKTFNIAGLPTSQIVIPNAELRERFYSTAAALGHTSSGVLDLLAATTAYETGEPWRRALLSYLSANYAYLDQFCSENLEGVRAVPLEGTYVPWLDFREYMADRGLTDKELKLVLRNDAGVWLHEGVWFGEAGAGFQRINIACPRSTLQTALGRMARVLGT